MERHELIETIPAEVLRKIRDRKVVDVGFGAGPSCIAGKSAKYDRPVALETGLEWIENYRDQLRKAHLLLDDGPTLYFDPNGFIQYDEAPGEQPPRPGVEMEVEDDDEDDDCYSAEDFFQYCACCGNGIHYGNAYLQIERLVQQIDYNPDDEGLVATVIDCAPLTYICYSCSSSNFATHRLRRQVAELLDLPAPKPFVTNPASDLAQTPDPCDCCGCQINPGNATVGLDIMIAQYDKPEGEDDGLITPIYTEELFTFCAACGNTMSVERLREAIDKVLIKVDGTRDDNDDENDDADGEEKYTDDDSVASFMAKILPALNRANERDKDLLKNLQNTIFRT